MNRSKFRWIQPSARFAVGSGIGVGYTEFVGSVPALDLAHNLAAGGAGAEGLGEKSPEGDGQWKAAAALLSAGCELGRRDRGLEELGELRKRGSSKLLGLILELLLGRARGATE